MNAPVEEEEPQRKWLRQEESPGALPPMEEEEEAPLSPRALRLASISRPIQSGSIGGLLAIPFIVEAGNYRQNEPLNVAGVVLLVAGLVSSLILSRTCLSERGLWGAVLTLVLYAMTWSQPVILSE